MTFFATIDESLLDREFPVRHSSAYLNTASIGPLPTRSLKAATRYLRDQNTGANSGYSRWAEALERAKEHYARLINVDPDEVAFAPNTSRGILLVANGLEWRSGDNIVIPEYEFPANMYPWKNLEYRGVELRVVPEREGCFSFEDIVALTDERTRLLAISFVEYSTGFRHDLDRLGTFCRSRGILFCVDAIQGVGALPLDARKTPVDFLACGGHKWLLGPCGTGFFYVGAEMRERIRFGFRCWGSMERPGDFENWTQPLAPTARRFEEGTPNYFGMHALEQSLGLILEIGVEAISQKIFALGDRLAKGLLARGYAIVSSGERPERSGITAFRSNRFDSLEIYRGLYAQGVITACRRGFVRVSPHIHNRAEDIDRLLETIPEH